MKDVSSPSGEGRRGWGGVSIRRENNADASLRSFLMRNRLLFHRIQQILAGQSLDRRKWHDNDVILSRVFQVIPLDWLEIKYLDIKR